MYEAPIPHQIAYLNDRIDRLREQLTYDFHQVQEQISLLSKQIEELRTFKNK